MACGELDGLLEKNDAIAKRLSDHKITYLYETGPGAHEWDFWDTYIKRAIDWLPLEETSVGVSSGNVGI